jgi:hypothetical protein
VSLKRRLSSGIVAFLAFSAHAGYAAPAESTQVVRALWCCATHCRHTRSATTAAHCCKVGRSGGGAVATSAVPKLPARGLAFRAASAAPGGVSPVDGHGTGWIEAIPAPRARGAPLFLLTRSLRI